MDTFSRVPNRAAPLQLMLLTALISCCCCGGDVISCLGRDSLLGGSLAPVPPGSLSGDAGSPKRCELVTIPMCRGVGYNYTSMPNQFSHDTQEEAGMMIHSYRPLIEFSCSEDLRTLICSTYAPACLQNYDKPLAPCRSVCERAKRGCAPLMRQYGFSWPDHLDCTGLPENAKVTFLPCHIDHGSVQFSISVANGIPSTPISCSIGRAPMSLRKTGESPSGSVYTGDGVVLEDSSTVSCSVLQPELVGSAHRREVFTSPSNWCTVQGSPPRPPSQSHGGAILAVLVVLALLLAAASVAAVILIVYRRRRRGRRPRLQVRVGGGGGGIGGGGGGSLHSDVAFLQQPHPEDSSNPSVV